MKKVSDVLFNHIGYNLYFDLTKEQIERVTAAMKEYAREAIKADRENMLKI